MTSHSRTSTYGAVPGRAGPAGGVVNSVTTSSSGSSATSAAVLNEARLHAGLGAHPGVVQYCYGWLDSAAAAPRLNMLLEYCDCDLWSCLEQDGARRARPAGADLSTLLRSVSRAGTALLGLGRRGQYLMHSWSAPLLPLAAAAVGWWGAGPPSLAERAEWSAALSRYSPRDTTQSS